MPRGEETPDKLRTELQAERHDRLHLMDDDMDDLGYGSSYEDDEDEDEDGYGIRSSHGESLWDSTDEDDEDEEEEEDGFDDDLIDDEDDKAVRRPKPYRACRKSTRP